MSAVPRALAWFAVSIAALLNVFGRSPVGAQQVRGRVVDGSNGRPVQLAGVWLLDRHREQVDLARADSLGRYFLTAPGS